MDNIDKQLIRLLQENARSTISVLSNKVGLSMPAVSERVKRLEQNGIIKQFTALLNPDLVDKQLVALVHIGFENPKYMPDFIDFTNTPSMNVAPTTDYAIPVVNQPVYDAPIVSTQEFKNEENTPIENAPFEISSIVPQPLEDDDDEDEEDDYSSVENQEPNTEAPVSSQTFVANDEDINDEETPW